MNAIAQLGVQAGRAAVLGDGPLLKFAGVSGVPLAVIHEMALLGGVDHATVIKTAYDHPEEFFELAGEIEKLAGQGQFSQALTRAWEQGEGSPGRQALEELPGRETMKGRLKNEPVQSRINTDTTSPKVTKRPRSTQTGRSGTTRMGEVNPTKRLAQSITRATETPGAGEAVTPVTKKVHAMGFGNASPPSRRILGRSVESTLGWRERAQNSPFIAKLLQRRKQLLGPGGAGGDGASTAGTGGGGIMNWIKSNPGKAALLGIGVPAGAYGLTRLMIRSSDDEKEGGDYLGNIPRNRKELEKRAKDVMRHNALVILNRHLDKMAADVDPRQVKSLRTIQSSVLGGSTLYDAVGRAFPKMSVYHRVKVAMELTKNAMRSFLKEAFDDEDDEDDESANMCSSNKADSLKGRASTRKEFHGKPAQAMGWMKSN